MELPPLPLEIWVRVIGSISDCRYLPRTWLNCRRVSHAFKAATEMAFVDTFLPQMRVCVELAELVELTFVGLSAGDCSRACFRQVGPTGIDQVLRMPEAVKQRLREETQRTWKREHDRYLESLSNGSPFLLYTTWLSGLVEDAEFPDLEVDFGERTISFTWEPMLDALFGEVEYRKWAARQISTARREAAATDQSELHVVGPGLEVVRSVEKRVRQLRSPKYSESGSSGSDRRQEWQLDALIAYRAGQGHLVRHLEGEEGWGTFYDGLGMTLARFEDVSSHSYTPSS